jgi:hypothetical protein
MGESPIQQYRVSEDPSSIHQHQLSANGILESISSLVGLGSYFPH